MTKRAALSEGRAALPTRVSAAPAIKRERAAAARPRGALALVGAWSEVADQDVDALIADIYARRAGDPGRHVELVGVGQINGALRGHGGYERKKGSRHVGRS